MVLSRIAPHSETATAAVIAASGQTICEVPRNVSYRIVSYPLYHLFS